MAFTFPIEDPRIKAFKAKVRKQAEETAQDDVMSRLRASVRLPSTSGTSQRERTAAEADPFGITVAPADSVRRKPRSSGDPRLVPDQTPAASEPSFAPSGSIPTAQVQPAAVPENTVPSFEGELIERESPEQAKQRRTERLFSGELPTPEPGSFLAQVGVTEPPGPREPIDFGPGAKGLGLGLLHVGGAFAEPAIQPLDVLAQTGSELFQGKKPTVFSEGYTASLEKFRDRSLLVQIALGGAFDPLVVGKLLSIPAKASATTVRSLVRAEVARAAPGTSRNIITEATDEVLRRLSDTLGSQRGGTAGSPKLPGRLVDQTTGEILRRLTQSEKIDNAGRLVDDLESQLKAVAGDIEAMADPVVRPAWATGLNNATIKRIAQHENRNPYLLDWDAGLDSVVIKEAQQGLFNVPTDRSLAQLGRDRTALRNQLKQANDDLDGLLKQSFEEDPLAEGSQFPLPPIDPPGKSPKSGPGLSAEPPSGRPRTIADMLRESRGLRGVTPEARAGIMDKAKPVGDVIYQVESYAAPAARLLGPDSTVNSIVRRIPGARQVAGLIDPAQVGRDNPVQMIGVRSGIFKNIETARARFAVTGWWNDAQPLLGFKRVQGVWRATKVQVVDGADTLVRTKQTINDLIEHPERYVFTPEQARVLRLATNTQTQILRDAQRAGVDVLELSTDYWRRIVTKGPRKERLVDTFIQKRIGGRKGHTHQRAFTDIDEGVELGYVYETDPRAILGERLESGITTIADQRARKEISNLVGADKPLDRLQARFPDTVEGVAQAKASRDGAKGIYLAKGGDTAENLMTLRQAEADYVTALRELFIKKGQAGQPGFNELALPNGRIAPHELVEEVNKYLELPELRRGATGGATQVVRDIFGVFRSVLTSMDLAAGFIQGQTLFYRNHVAWWKAQGGAVVSIVDDPTAYVAKNADVIDEGVRMGAITSPTEFLFASRGIGSIPTKIPLLGPAFKASNRAFEWFILVGQTELFKAGRSRIAAQGGGVDELVSLGTAVRKGLGVENYAILGVRPTQQTIETLSLFAARFFRANVGILAQTFTAGAGGAEARRLMGSMLAGGTALLYGIHWQVTGRAPNVEDPFETDWMQVPIGKTFFNPFGPFYPYFRALARMSVHTANRDPEKAAKEFKNFMASKESLPFRTAQIGMELAVKGESRTFEGDVITRSPGSIAKGVFGEQAVPIAPGEIVKGFQEGRPEAMAEVLGLTGRASPFAQMSILYQRAGDINPERGSLRDAEPWQRDEMEQRFPELAERMVDTGRGKFGDARRAWGEVDAKYYVQEEALSAEFLSRSVQGEELRKRYGAIQGEKAAEKQQVNESLDLFQDERELPDDPNERALAEFYQAQRQATRGSGIYDFEQAEILMAELDARWTTEQSAYVNRNTGRVTHPPLMQDFRDDVKLLKPYWDIEDEVVASLPTDKAKELWAEYRQAAPATQRQLQGVVQPITNAISQLHKKYRAENPTADAALVRWGYQGVPVTAEGRAAFQRSGRPNLVGQPTIPSKGATAGPTNVMDRLRSAVVPGAGGQTGQRLRERELLGVGR